MHDLAFVFAGFFVGFVVGLTGVGGGSLMTPILIFFFGIKPYLAVGTDLLFAAFTKMGGTVSLARRRMVPWRLVGALSMGSIPATLATLYVLHLLGPANPVVQKVMTLTLGSALLLTALATLYKAIRGKQVPRSVDDGKLAARNIAIDLMGTLHAAVGDLNRVRRIVKLMSLVNSTGEFTEHHLVTNGASELIGQVFGPAVGAHARSAFGVAQVPLGACVEIEMIAEIG